MFRTKCTFWMDNRYVVAFTVAMPLYNHAVGILTEA
jgi:hypothetical protein